MKKIDKWNKIKWKNEDYKETYLYLMTTSPNFNYNEKKQGIDV